MFEILFLELFNNYNHEETINHNKLTYFENCILLYLYCNISFE